MQTLKSSALAAVVVAVGLVVAAPAESNAAREPRFYRASHADSGRLVIRYSPLLGINVALYVEIDGRVAGGFTKGHTYVKHLAPGRHRILVGRNGRRDVWTRTLHVRPGETYSYIAKYRVNQVWLERTGRSR